MVFRRIQAECDLPLFHPHLLRHQAATEVARNNIEGYLFWPFCPKRVDAVSSTFLFFG